MGQLIEIEDSRVVDGSVIVTTNRSLTSTNGEGYGSQAETADTNSFGAGLAADLFESDGSLSRVFVASNVVTITRDGGWPDEAVASVSSVIRDFFLYY